MLMINGYVSFVTLYDTQFYVGVSIWQNKGIVEFYITAMYVH